MSHWPRRLLIANRGEIALRIIRTARRLGIETVAVHSEADSKALHVHAAEVSVCIGPPPAASSYLSHERILDAARRTGADALHPGYGFLAESPTFAQACADAGILFVGPSAATIERVGHKGRARACARAAGVACVPGFDGAQPDDAELTARAHELGFPLLVKAAAGGGGRGMRRVDRAEAFGAALALARQEALSSFGDPSLLLEALIVGARHVEVQVLGDAHGSWIHLGERDCSVQRRHQKVIEETPGPGIDAAQRGALTSDALALARAASYVGAGTCEFLLAPDGAHYFLEMNARLQVEHAITELVTGLDLVELQLRVAAGEPLPIAQGDVVARGHAIEARLYAEDPARGFVPCTGAVRAWEVPTGEGLRCDSAVEAGQVLTPHYDALLAKLVAHGETREEARRRLIGALRRTVVLGPDTNRTWLVERLADPTFVAGRATTDWIENEPGSPPPAVSSRLAAVAAALWIEGPRAEPPDFWRNSGRAELFLDLRTGEPGSRCLALHVVGERSGACEVSLDGSRHRVRVSAREGARRHVWLDGVELRVHAAFDRGRLHVQLENEEACFETARRTAEPPRARGEADVVAPSSGRVVEVLVAPGQAVAAGQPALRIEAMKLQSVLDCARPGQVREVRAFPGQQVEAGQILVTVDPSSAEEAIP